MRLPNSIRHFIIKRRLASFISKKKRELTGKYNKCTQSCYDYLKDGVYLVELTIMDILEGDSYAHQYLVIHKPSKVFEIPYIYGTNTLIEFIKLVAKSSCCEEKVKYYKKLSLTIDSDWCNNTCYALKVKLPEYIKLEKVDKIPDNREYEKCTAIYGYN